MFIFQPPSFLREEWLYLPPIEADPINYKKKIEVSYRGRSFKNGGGRVILFLTNFFKDIIFILILPSIFCPMFDYNFTFFFLQQFCMRKLLWTASNKKSDQSDGFNKNGKKHGLSFKLFHQIFNGLVGWEVAIFTSVWCFEGAWCMLWIRLVAWRSGYRMERV